MRALLVLLLVGCGGPREGADCSARLMAPDVYLDECIGSDVLICCGSTATNCSRPNVWTFGRACPNGCDTTLNRCRP